MNALIKILENSTKIDMEIWDNIRDDYSPEDDNHFCSEEDRLFFNSLK